MEQELNLDRAKIFNITIRSGDSYDVGVTVTDVDGLQFNFSGCTAKLRVIPELEEGVQSEAELTTESGEIILSLGQMILKFSSAKTLLESGTHYYILKIFKGADVFTWLVGKLVVLHG